MKKALLTILLLGPFIVRSQTITTADLPTAGLAWITGNDSTYSQAIPSGGTGQTWDLLTLPEPLMLPVFQIQIWLVMIRNQESILISQQILPEFTWTELLDHPFNIFMKIANFIFLYPLHMVM